jgi:hypothetical protein
LLRGRPESRGPGAKQSKRFCRSTNSFRRWNRPIFAVHDGEISGKPPPIREAVLPKKARLFILRANVATVITVWAHTPKNGGLPGCSL